MVCIGGGEQKVSKRSRQHSPTMAGFGLNAGQFIFAWFAVPMIVAFILAIIYLAIISPIVAYVRRRRPAVLVEQDEGNYLDYNDPVDRVEIQRRWRLPAWQPVIDG